MKRTLIMDVLHTVLLLAVFTFSKALDIKQTFRDTGNTELEHLSIHKTSGEVFLGATNKLLRLSPRLLLLESVPTGKREDNPNCPPPVLPCDETKYHMNSYSKNLVIDYKNDVLIACSSLYHGFCERRPVTNMSHAERYIFKPMVPNDQLSSSVIVIAPGVSSSSSSSLSLYIAATYTDYGLSGYRDLVPAISARNVDTFEYSHRDANGATLKKIQTSFKKQLLVSYIYGFSYNGFMYFISLQKESLDSSRLITKVIRICEKDKYFNSYLELPLICGDDSVVYNQAEAAFVDTSKRIPKLYVVFSKVFASSEAANSAMCVYSLFEINQQMNKAVQDCYNGRGKLGPAHITPVKPCPTSSSTPDYCARSADASNYPSIAAPKSLSQTPVLQVNGSTLTAVTSWSVNLHPVVFLGTADGRILKAVRHPDGNFSISEDVLVDEGRPIKHNLVKSTDGIYLYAISIAKVAMLEVASCNQYKDCHSCTKHPDPYCGWCVMENRCTLKSSCASSEVTPAWLPASEMRCVEIRDLRPPAFSVETLENTAKTNSIIFKVDAVQLPQANNLRLVCAFVNGPMKITTQAILQADHNFRCELPPIEAFPDIPSGIDHEEIELQLRVGDKTVVKRSVHLYDCRVHSSCISCTGTQFSCQWCAATHTCMNATSATCPITSNQFQSLSQITDPDQCPVMTSPNLELVVHSGEKKEVSVQLKNLQPYQSKDLRCHFQYQGKANSIRATYSSGRLYCDVQTFTYPDEETPYVMSDLKVTWGDDERSIDNPENIKVRIYKCSLMVTNCGKCLSLDSGYKCGWCADRCSLQKHCSETWLDRAATCPSPQILRFSPQTGPVGGRTNISVTGINLGKHVSDIQGAVQVAGIKCIVEHEGYKDSSGFTCETELTTVEEDGVITVSVDGKFTAESDSSFSFVTPQPLMLFPKRGPVSGGTTLMIKGTRMDAGNAVSVKIGNNSCVVKERNSTAVMCVTAGQLSPNDVSVEVNFGGSKKMVSEMFSYETNPTITMIEPKAAIMSGGTVITIMGTQLDIVQHPKFFIKTNGQSAYMTCTVTNEYMIQCPIPALPAAYLSNVTSYSPVEVHYGFVMDGVKKLLNISHSINFGPLLYYPDPIIMPFANDETPKQYEEMEVLVIEGQFPNVESLMSDVVIYVGTTVCKSMAVSENKLKCKPAIAPAGLDLDGNAAVQVKLGNFEAHVGYLNYYKPLMSEKPIALGIILGVVLPILLIVTLLAFCVIRRHIKQSPADRENYLPDILRDDDDDEKIKDEEICLNHVTAEVSDEESTAFINSLINDIGDEQLQASSRELIIPRSKLEMGSLVGKGYYGYVYKADMRQSDDAEPVTVAVKTLHGNINGSKNLQSFIKEAIGLKDLTHPNILSLIGVCLVPSDVPMVILPFMKKGDLHSYVQDPKQNLTVMVLLEFASQIAEGMAYLEELRFVHRNLAARNCLVTDENRIKISDYGLTKDLFTKEFMSKDDNSAKLLTKWMAPEVLENYDFSTKSDVWSYGVIMWELMTRGVTPYPDIEPADLIKYIADGNRMKKPKQCPEFVYHIMQQCWQQKPDDRPTFSLTVTEMKKLMQPLNGSIDKTSETQPLNTNIELATSTEYLEVIG